MIKRLLQIIREFLRKQRIEALDYGEKCCGNCRYMELIPFDDFRCMNVKSEYFHCEVYPHDDVCLEYEEKEKQGN